MRLTGFKAKSRFTVALSAAIAAFTLSACGGSNSTITITTPGSGGTIWGVITTDSTAIPVIKNAESHNASASVHDGDIHQGHHVCGFNVSKNGHSYQFDWYTDNSLVDSFLNTECGSTFQQQFLSEAP